MTSLVDHEAGQRPPSFVPASLWSGWNSFLDWVPDFETLPSFLSFALEEKKRLLQELRALEKDYKTFLVRIEYALELEASKVTSWERLSTHLSNAYGLDLAQYLQPLLSWLGWGHLGDSTRLQEQLMQRAREAKSLYEERKSELEKAMRVANRNAKELFFKSAAKGYVIAMGVTMVSLTARSTVINLLSSAEPTPTRILVYG